MKFSSIFILSITIIILLVASISVQSFQINNKFAINDGCPKISCAGDQDCCTPQCECVCIFSANSKPKTGYCGKVNGGGRRRRFLFF